MPVFHALGSNGKPSARVVTGHAGLVLVDENLGLIPRQVSIPEHIGARIAQTVAEIVVKASRGNRTFPKPRVTHVLTGASVAAFELDGSEGVEAISYHFLFPRGRQAKAALDDNSRGGGGHDGLFEGLVRNQGGVHLLP
jgi:hypothetical protein